MKGCEDFLAIVLHAHVVSAAKTLVVESFDNAKDLAREILEQFVSFDANEKISRADKYLYATQLMTLLLLWHAFNDAVREDDGDWIIS